jgi:hypothetical protein
MNREGAERVERRRPEAIYGTRPEWRIGFSVAIGGRFQRYAAPGFTDATLLSAAAPFGSLDGACASLYRTRLSGHLIGVDSDS